MKRLTLLVATLAGVCILGACPQPSTPETEEVVLKSVAVGTKTELYEVVAPGRLRLAPGVKSQVVEDLGGRQNVIVIMRPNGGIGGYVTCQCVGATSGGSCKASSDNPENHPVCIGSCTDSEGVPRPSACDMRSGNIGPPRDPPVNIKFVDR